jgi:hypothetical protein
MTPSGIEAATFLKLSVTLVPTSNDSSFATPGRLKARDTAVCTPQQQWKRENVI